ncbi:MAG: hypothetical protein Q9177_001496 [Variospora cf. flavescens]
MPAHQPPSPWDSTYTRDLHTNSETPAHTGTTWFADSCASTKTLSYLHTRSPSLSRTSTTFLDLGTGNGEMLFLLRSPEGGGFTGRMLGIDYSAASVELASRISARKGYKETEVGFKEWDILDPGKEWKEGAFDVVLDKGTFDAVSLNAETDAEGKRVCEGYRGRVLEMVKKGGRFLVTSCNWTEEELKAWFDGAGGQEVGFEWEGKVEYPKFRFGGKSGQSVSGVCFRRV